MQPQTTDSESFRLIVLGSAGVGKSTLVSMFIRGSFDATYKPTVGDFYVGYASQGRRRCRLEIVDASGSCDFPAMRKLYISTGHVFLLVHSLQDPNSFKEVLRILEQIIDERPEPEVPILVVGTKSDQKCPDSVSCAEAELRLMDYMNIVRYAECNAKKAGSVNRLFGQVADVAWKSRYQSNTFEEGTVEQPNKRSKSFLRKLKSICSH